MHHIKYKNTIDLKTSFFFPEGHKRHFTIIINTELCLWLHENSL